jgi:evolutionarily conserved signaling intermediate in Toll pathway
VRVAIRAFDGTPAWYAVGKDKFKHRPPSDLTIRQEAEIVRKTAYFDEVKKDLRDKNAFRYAIGTFLQRDIRRAGHVEFIYAALKRVKAFGVHKDLEIYKDIMNIFPKGRYIAENIWQVEFHHYPRHQECGIDVLCEMEKHGKDFSPSINFFK